MTKNEFENNFSGKIGIVQDNFPQDKSRFKLLICDFDGTLAGKDHIVTSKVEEAIRKWVDSGRNFSIATGRQYLMLDEECQRLKLSTPIVVRGGAEVVDAQTGKILHKEWMTKEEVDKVFNTLIQNNIGFLAEKENILYANIKYEVDFPKIFYKDLSEFEISEIPKFVIKSKDEDVERIQKLMDELENSLPSINIVKVHGKTGHGWDITSVKATKLFGVLKVMEHYGVSRDEVVGVGDSYNDFPLLEASGFKVAMGNAHQEVKDIADVIIPPFDQDGVSYLIHKLLE